MADNSKDVELRIRARDYSQKTLQQLVKTVSALTEVQQAQQDMAELGEGSNKALAATYNKLEDAGRALLRLDSLTQMFKRQNAAVEDAVKKTTAARDKQQALAKAYAETEKVTAKQEAALASATKRLETATRAEETRRTALSRTAAEMKRYGIDVSNVSGAESTYVAQVNRVNEALTRQNAVMNALPANQRAAALRAEAEAQARATQAFADKEVAAAQARIAAEKAAADKIVASLQLQADQALATARGYQTLGRVVTAYRKNQNNLERGLVEIVSPAQAARRTLQGLAAQIDAVGNEVAQSGSQIKDGARKLRELGEAQKSLTNMGAMVDKYRQQVDALKQAREEYVRNRAQVKLLAAELRTSGSASDELNAKMKAAQSALAASANSMRILGTSARTTRDELRTAGVDTRNLAAAETKLVDTANRSVAASKQLADALNKQAKGSNNAKGALSGLADSGRQSLSVFQRLRGEILALVTAYAGVQGMINLAGGAVDAYKVRQQAMIKISTVVGQDQARINAEWEYMTKLADTLGIKLEDLAGGYTKFAVAANAVGMSQQETKFIFENIAKAGRVFGLSADDMNGVFKAMEQMLSKGQVYAEELRGQLGERLPGAVAMFAKSMNKTVAELSKEMQDGTVTAEEVINYAREQGKAVDAQMAAAKTSVGAAEARLQNAMFMYKLAIADSGFLDAYSAAIERLTKWLNSEQGQQTAVKLADAFSAMADALIWCVDNIDLIVQGFKALIALKVGAMLIGMTVNVVTMIGRISALWAGITKMSEAFAVFAGRMVAGRGAALLLSGALRLLLRAIPLIGWALLAWDIGSILYDYSEDFRKFVDTVWRDMQGLIINLKTEVKLVPAFINDIVTELLRGIQKMSAGTVKIFGDSMATIARLVPNIGEELANSIEYSTNEMLAKIPQSDQRAFDETRGVWADGLTEWEKVVAEYDAKWQEKSDRQVAVAEKNDQRRVASARNAAAEIDGFTADPGTGATERDREIARQTKALARLETQAKKANVASKEALMKKDLPGRLSLIDQEFADQLKTVQGIGGPEGAKLEAQLKKVIALRKEAETRSYQAENANAEVSAVNKRAKAIEALRAEYEKLAAATDVQEAKVDPGAAFADRLAAALQKVSTQYDQLIAKANKLGGVEGAQLANKLSALKAQNLAITTQKSYTDELARIQEKADSAIATKKALLEEINSLREAGVISEDEQVKRTVEIYSNQNALIAQSVDELERFANIMRDRMTPQQWAEINAQIAQMRAGLTSMTGTYTQLDTIAVQTTLDGMTNAFDSVAESLANVIQGTGTLGDVFRGLLTTTRQFFADLLMNLAKAIIQQQILNAISNAGWGGVSSAAMAAGGAAAASSSSSAAVMHSGGTVGSASRSRSAPVSWFANTQRYHSGGIPGLKQDEVATILQKGEQVLSKDDPNNVLNSVGKAQVATAAAPQVKVVNTFDSGEVVSQGLSTSAGEKAIMNIVRGNRTTIKKLLGG